MDSIAATTEERVAIYQNTVESSKHSIGFFCIESRTIGLQMNAKGREFDSQEAVNMIDGQQLEIAMG